MDTSTTIHSSSYNEFEDYMKDGNKLISQTLIKELSRFDITASDLNQRETAIKYKIGKHSTKQPEEIQEIYSAMGITLVEAVWLPTKLIVSTPRAYINYSESKRYIKEQLDLDLQAFRYREPLSDDLDPSSQD